MIIVRKVLMKLLKFKVFSSEAVPSLPAAVHVLWQGLQPAVKFSCCHEQKQLLLPPASEEVTAAHASPPDSQNHGIIE